MSDLPLGESLIGEADSDPGGQQIAGAEVKLMGRQRRHAAETIAENALQNDGMCGITGHDESIRGIISRVGRLTVDEMGLVESEPWAGIPTLCAGSAGLMALNAIHRQIGTGAIF